MSIGTEESEVLGFGQLLPRRLLLAVDGSPLSDRLVGYVAALGAPFQVDVTVVRVLGGDAPFGTVDALEFEIERASAERHLQALALRLREAGIDAEIRVFEGRVPDRILHYAQDHGFDAIVLSSHGEGGLSGFALGSTASKLVHCASSSLFVVPARSGALQAGFRRIFVPLDGSKRSECALPLVEKLAAHHGAEVCLFHAVAIPSCPRRTLPSREESALVARLIEHNRTAASGWLAETARHLGHHGVVAHTKVDVTRRVNRSIADSALASEADLMILCAHGETGDPDEQHGSVAAHFLRRPVLPTLVVQDIPVTGVVSRTPIMAERRGLSVQREVQAAGIGSHERLGWILAVRHPGHPLAL